MSTREDWLNQAVEELRPVFDASGFVLPANIRVTCGFPSRHARSLNRAIGEHWSDKASSDGTHEILISPVEADPFEVFGILVHELAHSATDGDGHRGRFPSCVKALHLEGKPTSTKVGQRFRDNFGALVESLGVYPHARLNVGANRKTQSTRMLKASCPACGYTIRLTKTWADKGLPVCPSDGQTFVL
jgi:ribosomal protein L37E